MRQIARRLKDGQLTLVEVPEPAPGPGQVLVRVEASVLSSGTERATLEVARKGLIAKARARPDQARQVFERVRREGIRETAAVVRDKLETLGPLGYSAAGTVVEVGADVRGIRPGDRVAIAGGGFANHAEFDVVPSLLCAKVPDGVAATDAAFATLGAIAMNGLRRAEVQLGATVAVIGLGLIGQLAVRLAAAAGCRVLGVDLKPHLVELARAGGVTAVSRDEIGPGSRWLDRADAVVICAATTSDDPIQLAASLARDRAPVVVVGDVAMNVPRAPFYDKELDLRLARSYGPGRYDPNYELHGLDYPIGHVRWTEGRNLEAFLQLVAEKKLRPSELISHRYPFAEAETAFSTLSSDPTAVAIALEYDESAGTAAATSAPAAPVVRRPRTEKPRFGLVGPGSFASTKVIPGLLRAGLTPAGVASASGLSAESARERFGFEAVSASAEEMLATGDLDLLVVTTQHDTHARIAALALEHGVPVYVEKPLALDEDDLAMVAAAQRRSGVPLFVGFNRRYSPAAKAMRELDGPRLMSYRVNAGPLPADHWLNDPARGGGRLVGEGCHFVDFLCDQAAVDPVEVRALGFASRGELPVTATDNFSVQITFADGSAGTIAYAADAPLGPGKERFECSAPGAFAVTDDFRQTSIWRGKRPRDVGGRRQDKGFAAQFELVADVIKGRAEAPPFEGFLLSSLTTLAARRSLLSGDSELVVERRPAAERAAEPNGSPSAASTARPASAPAPSGRAESGS